MWDEFIFFGDNEQHWHGTFSNILKRIHVIHVVASIGFDLPADILQHALDEDCGKANFFICDFQCGFVHAHECTVDDKTANFRWKPKKGEAQTNIELTQKE